MDIEGKRSSTVTTYKTSTNTPINSLSRLKQGNQSWKCYLNPKINYQYHKIMYERKSSKSRQKSLKKKKNYTSSVALCRNIRPISEKQLKFPITRKNHFKSVLEEETSTQMNTRYKSQSIGVQTKEMIVIEPSTYQMQEEERKYLRN